MEVHIHMVTHLHPMLAPAILVKDIKLVPSDFIKKERIFLNFNGWQGARLPNGQGVSCIYVWCCCKR